MHLSGVVSEQSERTLSGARRANGVSEEFFGSGNYLNKDIMIVDMKQEMVTIPKQEYEDLKKQANIDEELLHELVQGLKDIKSGNIERVR